MTGEDGGCPEVYDDASVDGILSLVRSGAVEIAAGAALNAGPIADRTRWFADVRLEAQVSAGPVSVTVAPSVGFALNDRDAPSRRGGISFDLSVYDLVLPQDTQGNHETLSVPVTVQLQVADPLAVFAGASIDGPLDPPVGSFSDAYTGPATVGLLYASSRSFEVGAAVTFPNLVGNDGTADGRVGSVFLGLRR